MKHVDRSPKPRRRTVALLATGAAVLAVATGVTALTLTSQSRVDRAPFEALLPASTGLAASFSANDDAWGAVSAFDAPLALGLVSPSKAPAEITDFGFSLSSSALREVYLQTPSEADAREVADWLAEQDGADQRVVAANGPTLLVTGPTEDGIAAAAAFPDREETEAAPTDDLRHRPADADALWVDAKGLSAALGADDERAQEVGALASGTLGLSSDTRWMGTTKTGNAFTGDFLQGGFDASRLDPLVAGERARAFGIDAEASASEKAAAAAVNALGATYAGGSDGLAESSFPQGQGEEVPKDLPAGDVTAILGTTTWIESLTGQSLRGEGISALALSIESGAMTVELRLNSTPYSIVEAAELPAIEEAPTVTIEPPVTTPPADQAVTDAEGSAAPQVVAPAPPPPAPSPVEGMPLEAPEAPGEPADATTIPPGFGAGG